MREALKNIICPACRGSVLQEEDKHQGLLRLRMENTRLKEEASRFCPVIFLYTDNRLPFLVDFITY